MSLHRKRKAEDMNVHADAEEERNKEMIATPSSDLLMPGLLERLRDPTHFYMTTSEAEELTFPVDSKYAHLQLVKDVTKFLPRMCFVCHTPEGLDCQLQCSFSLLLQDSQTYPMPCRLFCDKAECTKVVRVSEQVGLVRGGQVACMITHKKAEHTVFLVKRTSGAIEGGWTLRHLFKHTHTGELGASMMRHNGLAFIFKGVRLIDLVRMNAHAPRIQLACADGYPRSAKVYFQGKINAVYIQVTNERTSVPCQIMAKRAKLAA
jgi:hypothetical protein